ncbi:MAG: sugar nucleotide-binding protein, partial [Thermoplasmata archaeon]
GKGSNFVDAITKKAKSGEKIQVVEDIVMTPTYTLDAANIIASVLRKGEEYGVYHASNEGMCSWFEFAKEIVRQLSIDIEVEPTKNTQPNRPAYTPLKSMKVKNRPWKDALACYLREKGHIQK